MNTINVDMLVAVEELLESPERIFEVVDKLGRAVILQNNKPAYVLVKFSEHKIEDRKKRVAPYYKLHEAMQIVLDEQEDKKMHAKDLSDEIFKRGLYLKQDGTQAMANQIRARCNNYSNLFRALANNVIQLIAEAE